jgi:hypothetical protein
LILRGDLGSSEKLIAGSLSLPSCPSHSWQEELSFRKRGLKGLLRCRFHLSKCFWRLVAIFLVSIVVVRFGGLADLTDERSLTREASGG